MLNLLGTWGIFPATVVGHSSGEIAAAYAAQAIAAEDAIMIAYYRGQVTRSFAKLWWNGCGWTGPPRSHSFPGSRNRYWVRKQSDQCHTLR